MKKILAIAFACGLLSITTTFAQTTTASKATPPAQSETKTSPGKAEAKDANMKECTDKSKSAASCSDKKSAGKSSCCMKGGKAEAKADDKDTKKAEKE